MSGKMSIKMKKISENIKKTAKEDPRRIIHCVKVGLALTIVSMLYYFRPLYQGFQQSALWAVLTVVVVFEYTAGGTISKSCNRGFATLVAGALGVGAEYLAEKCGRRGEPIVLGLLVFLLGSTMTFTRFIPKIKQKYDYGVLIFILTFSLVTVSGYRVDEIVALAHQRLSTILIGAATCVIISIFVCPVWAGGDLHNLIVANIDKLADFFEGIAGINSNNSVAEKDDKSYMEAYKSVLNTKATEESLANLAWWEPCHGEFKLCHPWKKYLIVGGLTRQCAYLIQSLTTCIQSHPKLETETPRRIEEECRRVSWEAGKTLREISISLKSMRHHSSTPIQTHLHNTVSAMDDLKILLENLTLDNANLTETMQVLTFASILNEVTKCLENMGKSFNELSESASFKTQIKSQVAPAEVAKPAVNSHGSFKTQIKSQISPAEVVIPEVNSHGDFKSQIKSQVAPTEVEIPAVNSRDVDHIMITIRGDSEELQLNK